MTLCDCDCRAILRAFSFIAVWFTATIPIAFYPQVGAAQSDRSSTVVSPSTHSPEQSPLIRVNVTPEHNEPIEVQVRGPFLIRKLGGKDALKAGKKLDSTTLTAGSKSLQLGGQRLDGTAIEIVPDQGGFTRVNQHSYRGIIRAHVRKDGSLSIVNVLPLEVYLASVVDSEMPAAFPQAAREAQAIVSRTYALYQKEHAHPAAVYDLVSSERGQRYLGAEYLEGSRRLRGESDSSRRAVDATQGIVCHDRGKVFSTYFCAACGGRTTKGSEVFSDASNVLASVPCDWCQDSPHYRWTTSLASKELLQRAQPLKLMNRLETIEQALGPGDGTICRFLFSDGKKRAEISAIELRQACSSSLRSPHFSLALEGDAISVKGRGHGHGVGLCQWGSRGLALAGKSSQEIILYYYPGCELAVLDD